MGNKNDKGKKDEKENGLLMDDFGDDFEDDYEDDFEIQ